MRAVDLEEGLLFLLIVHNRVLLHHFDLKYGITRVHLPIEVYAESLNIIICDVNVFLAHMDVKVRREIMNMRAN